MLSNVHFLAGIDLADFFRKDSLGSRSLDWLRRRCDVSGAAGRQADKGGGAGDTLLREARYVIFDTELTGLSLRKDSVVSLGAVVVESGRIPLRETFYQVVSPRTALTGKSVVIHGITPGEASACPGIEDLLPKFLEFCGDCILVGHFVSIDMQFLDRELRRLDGNRFRRPAIDTYRVDEWLRRRRENACAFHESQPDDKSLTALAKRYDIPVQSAHNALDDAFVTAQVWQRFLYELPLHGVDRIQDVLALSGK